MAKNVLSQEISEPANGVTHAMIDIDVGDGNLIVDPLTGSDQILASGTLEYLENQEPPYRSLDSNGKTATFALRVKSGKQPWFRLPWAACNGATEWLVHLNPTVTSEITAHSDGGNVRLDLAGMSITRLIADTGGGNIDVVLPENVENLNIAIKTGAGNVMVSLMENIAARIHATTGLGKALIDPRFSNIDKDTYQTTGFENAAKKVEMTLHSGAGNVSVKVRSA